MHQSYHGGSCCGMTHIFGFPSSPGASMSAVPRLNAEQLKSRAAIGMSRLRNNSFPIQSAAERLRQMIRGIEEGQLMDPMNAYVYQAARPKGCIEVVLTDYQTVNWKDTLLGLDFKIVNTFVNSNSNRTLYVFHRNSGAEGVKPIEPAIPTGYSSPVDLRQDGSRPSSLVV